MVLEFTESNGKFVVSLGPKTLKTLFNMYDGKLNIYDVLKSFNDNSLEPSFSKILSWDLSKDMAIISYFVGLLKRYSYDKETVSELVEGIM